MLRASCFAVLCASCLLTAQEDFSKVEMKVTKVAGTVYMLEGAGGNIGVSVGQDGIVIVDDQFAPLAPKIRAALRGISDRPLKYVLNTHYHFDHSGGNSVFGSEATIVAHENVRTRLKNGTETAGQKIPPAPAVALPVLTFNDRATIHLNGEDIRAIHVPGGHTDGDSVIYFVQSNVVHMGDDFVTYGFPFIDVASGGSLSGMIAGVTNVLNQLPADVKVIPGHGPVSSVADVRKFLDMLRETRSLVSEAVKKKMTPAQMKEQRILGKFEDLGKGFIKTDAWIDLLYADVTRRNTGALRYHRHGHAGEVHAH